MSTFVDIFLLILAIWTIPWKVYAVWTAVKRGQKIWFVILIIINTASILEIIYIFKVAKKSGEEVRADFRYGWEKFKDIFRKKKSQ
jgi:hypothetical protein